MPDKALNINFARLETTEDVELIIARTAEAFAPEINAARRNVQTHEQTKALADLLGMTPDQLLSRRSGQAYNAGQALAARKVLVASAESLSVLGRKIASRQATDIDKAAFQKQLATHYAIQAQVSGMTAEAGRALNAFKILAKSDAGRVKQIDEMMRRLDGANVSTEHLAEMIAGLDSAEGLNRFVRDAQKATGWDMFIEAWINALLSSPVTHAANTISNAITAVWQIPERGLAAGIGRLTGSDAIAANEAGQMAYGLVEGFKDGIKLAAKTLRTGDEPELFNKAETYRQRAISAKNFGMQDGSTAARAVDLVGNMVRMPGRLLASEDSFFKSVGYRMELRALALRLATVEGLDGQAFKNRIAELIENPPDSIQLGAIDAARYVTFTKELGEAGRAGQKYLSKIPALRLIVPFVQTPVNIVKFAGERTPLALISKNVRADIAAGGARRDLALARLASGSMVMSAAAVAVLEGKITGGGPENPELKAALRRQGWQPYSLKIGDTYYAYNRLEPLGMLMGIAADATEIISQSGEHEAMEVACAAVAAIAKNVTSKTWLRGAADALDVLDDPERNVKKFLQNYIGTIVPAGVAAIEKTVDPTVRSTYSDQGFFYEVANHVKSRVPGWSKELPPKRDLWGNPIAGEGSLGPDFISPLHMSTAEESPIDAALVADKIRLAPARKVQSFRGVPVALTPAEHDRFVVLENTIDLPQTGMPLKPSLDRLVQSREYERADPDIRERMVRQHVHAARELAKMALFDEARQIQDIVIEMQTRSQP